MVEAHGGTIAVDDGRLLGGARFRICLPLHTTAALASVG